MKLNFKQLAMAAALAATGASQAAPVTGLIGQNIVISDPAGSGRQTQFTISSGSGALSFSSGSGFDGLDPNTLGGLIGALNVGKVSVNGVGGATVAEDFITDEFGDNIRIGSTANASVISVTLDNQTGQMLSVGSTGGAVQVGTRISGTLTGGTASVTNLRFDLVNQVIYADLAGTKAAVGTAAAVSYLMPDTALWTFSSITGPTVIPPSALLGSDAAGALEAAGFSVSSDPGGLDFSATNVISGLKVTTAGFDFFKNSLGLLSTGVNALDAVNDDPQGWGSVTSTLNFRMGVLTPPPPPLPEPGTYAMMGMGLLAVGLALRNKRRGT